MISEYKSLFKSNRFAYLWFSQILSQLTINLINFLLLVTLFEKTGSTIATSFIWVAYAMPAIIVGPIAAATIDLADKRKVLVITNLLQSLTILVYALSYRSSLFLLYGVVVIYSLLNQFYVPAELASLTNLVKKRKLAHANGLFFLTQQASLILGFGIAGILNEIIGFTNTLYVCSGLLFLAFLSVQRLAPIGKLAKMPKSFEKFSSVMYKSILEGYGFIKNNNFVLAPLAIMLYLHVVLVVVTVNVPIIASDVFKVPVYLAGIMLAVPGGIGASLAALIIPRAIGKNFRKISVIKFSLLLITLSIFIIIFVLPYFENGTRFAVGAISMSLLGFSFVGTIIPAQTLFQTNTPSELRGRVFGNFWFLSTVASVFPVIFSGTIAEIFGIKFLLFLIAASAFSILIAIRYFADRILFTK